MNELNYYFIFVFIFDMFFVLKYCHQSLRKVTLRESIADLPPFICRKDSVRVKEHYSKLQIAAKKITLRFRLP